MRGEVIGINSAIASETGFNAGYGFAIPINLARTVMEQLVATGRVERAALGINITDATPQRRDLRRPAGNPGHPGPGLRTELARRKRPGSGQGDIIISVNGKPVNYTAQLQQAIGFNRPGQVVQVEVARRGGVRKTYPVKLIALDAPEVAQANAGPQDDSDAGPTGPPMTALGITVEPLKPADALELGLPARHRRAGRRERDPRRPVVGCAPAGQRRWPAGHHPERRGERRVHRGRPPQRAQEARPRRDRVARGLPCRCGRAAARTIRRIKVSDE